LVIRFLCRTLHVETTGHPRFPGNPDLHLLMVFDPGRTTAADQNAAVTRLPLKRKRKLQREILFRGSIAWLLDSLSTLRGGGYPNTTQDSLPAAGQALPGEVVSLGSNNKVSDHDLMTHPPLPNFAWRNFFKMSRSIRSRLSCLRRRLFSSRSSSAKASSPHAWGDGANFLCQSRRLFSHTHTARAAALNLYCSAVISRTASRLKSSEYRRGLSADADVNGED